jgi:aldose 1-epimerase
MDPLPFGTLSSGETVEAYTLSSEGGASARILTYGGVMTSLQVPDREGHLADIVLGFNDLGGYIAGRTYFGAIVGRIAGRVTGGRIRAGGQDHVLECNEGTNHLHGGRQGLNARLWTAKPQTDPSTLTLTYRSPDGEEGYPGTLDIAVTYSLTPSNALVIETLATSDLPTPLSLSHHSYFNLGGEGSGTVLAHEVMIPANNYVPAGSDTTLSDRRERVGGRGADLRLPRILREVLPELPGYHGDLYLLRTPEAQGPQPLTRAARVSEARSGRVLEVFTDESCLQFYTGAKLDGALVGKSGIAYGPFSGLCLECQGYPNATVQTGFGDILVQPGEPQRRRTVYAFSTL